MNKIKNAIANWEWTTQEIANLFVEKYFGKENDAWWIGNEVGGVLGIGDYFFNVDQMADFLKYNYSKKKMFDYYFYSLEMHEKGEKPWNIKTYKYVK